MNGKAVDCVGEVGLADWETKDSELAVNYCGDCHSRRESISQESLLESEARVEQASYIVPSLTPPSQSETQCSRGLPCPGEYLRPCPLTTQLVH